MYTNLPLGSELLGKRIDNKFKKFSKVVYMLNNLYQQCIYELCETDGRGPPLPGTLGQKLSIIRALLNIVKALLLISLCFKHPLKGFLSFKCAEMLQDEET
jgi:hypothetical protein